MPKKKSLLSSCAFIGVGALLSAQDIGFVSLTKSARHVQTDAGTVVLDPMPVGPDYGGPWGFEVRVEGTQNGGSIAGITPPVVSGPFTVGTGTGAISADFFNGGTLVYDDEDNAWGFGYPLGNDWGGQSKSEMDAIFGNGSYALSVDGTDLSLNLSPEDYPDAAPAFTLQATGGEWVNGRYHVPHDADLTITTNQFADYGDHAEDAVWMGMWSEDPDFDEPEELIHFASAQDPNFQTLTIPAGTFTPGYIYELDAGFFAATDFQSNPAWAEAMIVVGFEYSTSMQIVATPLPEPEPIEAKIDPAIAVRFTTQDGGIYRIEASEDLENWYEVRHDIRGDGSEMTFYFDLWSDSLHFRAVRTFP